MKANRQDLITAQLQRAEEAFAMAQLVVEGEFWNSLAGELYYTCFYLIQALFAANEIQAHTHTGVKSLFSLRFIKSKELDENWGKLLARLFEYRQEGNYGDYAIKETTILPLVEEVTQFKKVVVKRIEQSGYKTNTQS